ncbi:MAG: outer membrane beta-barrel protein [Terracidiphilus sp.]
MLTQRMRLVLLLLILAACFSLAAPAQTDVAASLYGAFTGTTNGNGTLQSPSNAAGVLFELRHISNPLVGYEATYSYNRANQNYSAASFACPVGTLPPCNIPAPVSVPADAHEITGDWIVSFGLANIKPFVLGGGGVLFNVPSYSSSTTSTSTRGVFVYGAGLDFGLLPHIGLRLQYRGNLYQAPDLTKLYTSTSAFTHTAEPMIGAYLRF